MTDIAITLTDFIKSLSVGIKNSFNHFIMASDGKYFLYLTTALILGVSIALIIYLFNKILERKIH